MLQWLQSPISGVTILILWWSLWSSFWTCTRISGFSSTLNLKQPTDRFKRAWLSRFQGPLGRAGSGRKINTNATLGSSHYTSREGQVNMFRLIKAWLNTSLHRHHDHQHPQHFEHVQYYQRHQQLKIVRQNVRGKWSCRPKYNKCKDQIDQGSSLLSSPQFHDPYLIKKIILLT